MIGRIGRFLRGIVAAKPATGGAGRKAELPPRTTSKPPRAGIAAAQKDVVVKSGGTVGATPISIPGPPPKAGQVVGGPIPRADLEAIRRPDGAASPRGTDGPALDPGRGGRPVDPGRRARSLDPGRRARALDPDRGGKSLDPGIRARSLDPERGGKSLDPGLRARSLDPDRGGKSLDPERGGRSV